MNTVSHAGSVFPTVRSRQLSALSLVTLAVVACGGSEGSGPSVDTPRTDGEEIFSQRLPSGNTFACATCHALEEPSPDGFRRPGHSLLGATLRSSFKNGQLSELIEAVNTCQVDWMGADPWTETDPEFLALRDFLAQRGGDATPLSFEIVPPAAQLEGGDPAAGEQTFNGTCAVCHAEGGVGSNLAPPIAGRGLSGELIARRVRTSGDADSPIYEGLTGGRMPFWAADRLSDEELRDIIAWLAQSGSAPVDPGETVDEPEDTKDGCGSDHPLVGATAELVGRDHDVAGTATIVDNCTIEFTNFTFDGGGIDVRVYGALGGRYDDGFAIGPDLTGPGFNNDTLRVQLDDSRSLDDLDGVSIWCVPIGIDFGSGSFQK